MMAKGKENFERGQSSGVLNTHTQHSTAHTEYDELNNRISFEISATTTTTVNKQIDY
jgi:hypothetical protein